MGIKKGVFAEFGAGDGTENNTICLAALGWKGFWVGGDDLKFNYNDSENFSYRKSWITKDCRRGPMKLVRRFGLVLKASWINVPGLVGFAVRAP